MKRSKKTRRQENYANDHGTTKGSAPKAVATPFLLQENGLVSTTAPPTPGQIPTPLMTPVPSTSLLLILNGKPMSPVPLMIPVILSPNIPWLGHVKPSYVKWIQVKSSDVNWRQVKSSDIKWHKSSEVKWCQVKSSEVKWHKLTSSEVKWWQVTSSKIVWHWVRSS